MRIQAVWTEFEEKQEELQKGYQDQLEDIITDLTQSKFEKLAEIKAQYCNAKQEGDEGFEEREAELQKVKSVTEKTKQERIKLAQEHLEDKKKQVQAEKLQRLEALRGELREGRMGSEPRVQDIDDNSAELDQQNTPDRGEKGPKRKKFKSPELKKNAASKKMTFEGVILHELEDDSHEEPADEERKDGSHQELPRVNESCASAEVSPAKASPQYKEMQDRKD